MKLNKIAIYTLIVSILFIVVGGLMAINSCAKSTEIITSPDEKDTELSPSWGNDNLQQSPDVEESPFIGLDLVLLPPDLPEQIKEYTGFKVSFNKENHTPNYVAWELLGSEVNGDVSRSNNFWQDAEIEGCPAHRDYTYSGYDRGHMCPAADQKWSSDAMNDCFVMANMCPQIHELNAGAWETLENKERQWAKRDSAIMIIAGPIYTENDTKRIGDIGVRVPGAFFKAFLAPYVKQPRAIAFVYPNMSSPGNMQDYSMSIDELEEILGYDLFSSLPDEIENDVEAAASFTEWNR